MLRRRAIGHDIPGDLNEKYLPQASGVEYLVTNRCLRRDSLFGGNMSLEVGFESS